MSEVYSKKELLALMGTGANKRMQRQLQISSAKLTYQYVSTVTRLHLNGLVSAMVPSSVWNVQVSTEVSAMFSPISM